MIFLLKMAEVLRYLTMEVDPTRGRDALTWIKYRMLEGLIADEWQKFKRAPSP
jgi:hypothetical protein